MRQIVTRKVDKHKHEVFFRKAESFRNEMKRAEQAEEWNAACLNAIHCAISSADALATFYLGERSASQSHDDAAEIVRRTGLAEAPEKARQLLDILQLKTLVEYEPEEPTEGEARTLLKQAERFFQWVKQSLKK